MIPPPPPELIERYAKLIGNVAIEWNTAQYALYNLFETLTGSKSAWSIFWGLRSDSTQRDITISAAKSWLNMDKNGLGPEVIRIVGELGKLAGERNAALHMPWGIAMDDWEGKPLNEWGGHRMVPLKESTVLREDVEIQFEELGTKIQAVTNELILMDDFLKKRLASLEKDPRQIPLPRATPRGNDPQMPE